MEPSQADKTNLEAIRKNITSFLNAELSKHLCAQSKILEIGPSNNFVRDYSKNVRCSYAALDIVNNENVTVVCDLCDVDKVKNLDVHDYDVIICSEVLEHTMQPFDAVNSIYHLLKKGGIALISTPFDLRIHGPLPDCWRFTEYGLRSLFSNFKIESLEELKQTRFLMPIQYTLVARK